jgi:probable rRNA maturation factor
VRIPISRDGVATVARAVLRAERVRDAMISVTFVTDDAMRMLNRRHLGRRGATDVIAFGLRDGGRNGALIGDVYVAPDVARESVRQHGGTLREEIVRLVVHGVLHVVGYDHPESDRRVKSPMWLRQERLVRRLMNRV